MAARLRERIAGDAMDHEKALKISTLATSVDRSTQTSDQDHRGGPGAAAVGQDNRNIAVDALPVEPSQRAQMKASIRQAFAGAYVRGMVSRDPAKAVATLREGGDSTIEGLTPEARAQALKMAVDALVDVGWKAS